MNIKCPTIKELEYAKELNDLLSSINHIKQDQDKTIKIYDPKLVKIAGGVCAAILLKQILYWTEKISNKQEKNKEICNGEFYKYRLPPKMLKNESLEDYIKRTHRIGYTPGNSWCEELQFTEREFDSALKSIAVSKRKLRKDKIKNEITKEQTPIKKNKCISYRTDGNKMTFYRIENPKKLNELIMEAHEKREINQIIMPKTKELKNTPDLQNVDRKHIPDLQNVDPPIYKT